MPTVVMFVVLSAAGACLAVVSASWFGAWVGLEMNLLMFIPVIMVAGDKSAVEAGLKYFLIQACGSLVILQLGTSLSVVSNSFILGLVSALTLKAGGAPFHFWLPMVVEGVSWGKVSLLLTSQKLAPLTLLFYSYSIFTVKLFNFIVLSSALVGAVGGINELMFRKLLAYSSVSHFSWMCLSMGGSVKVWLFYYISYCLIVGILIYSLALRQIFHFNHLAEACSGNLTRLLVGVNFLSLGGLPPFFGFLPKWLVMVESLEKGNFLALVAALAGSLVALFYYLRSSVTVYVSSKDNLVKGLKSMSWGELTGTWFNTAGLMLSSVVWSVSLLH